MGLNFAEPMYRVYPASCWQLCLNEIFLNAVVSVTLSNHEHQNKMLNDNDFENVSVAERNDIGGEAALEDDKLETKSKKGLVHRQPRMGIDLGSKHNAPGGDMATMTGQSCHIFHNKCYIL